MFNVQLLKNRYNTDTYPNLEERMNGALIPIGYGNVHAIVPTCIDTTTKKYKMLDHATHALDAVHKEIETLVAGSDYVEDLALAEFTLYSTPYLAANTTYYFAIEADFPISGGNYISFKLNGGSGYADGQVYAIDGAAVWTPDAAKDLLFRIQGVTALGGTPVTKINAAGVRGKGFYLRKSADHTRIGQSFKTGATAFYLTSVFLWSTKKGTVPASNLKITILSAYNPAEVRVGAVSLPSAIKTSETYWAYSVKFPMQNENTNLLCDVRGREIGAVYITDGADLLESIVVDQLGKPAALLDPAYLADFKAKRTYEMKFFCDDDTKFKEFLGKLETSLLFKLHELLDDTYAPIVYENDDPAGTPHFKDEDYVSFQLFYDWASVKHKTTVLWDENPGNKECKAAETTSHLAKFLYKTEETLEIQSYHATSVGASWLSGALSVMYSAPPLMATFEVHGYGLDLIPAKDKVRLTRTRAAYAGGVLNGVLFRILKLQKKPETSTTVITCQLDTQTYPAP